MSDNNSRNILTTGDAIASPVSTVRLIKCAAKLDTDDPTIAQFNAAAINDLILAQKAAYAFAKDVTSMLKLPIHAFATNSHLTVQTNKPLVAYYLITNAIICDWRPNLGESEDFANCPQLDPCKSVLLRWQYYDKNNCTKGCYAIELA